MPPAPDLSRQELPGLPIQHGVGDVLERLAEHDEAAALGVAGAQVDVAQPAPVASPPARLVGRPQRLGHQPFRSGIERRAKELFGREGVSGDEPWDPRFRGDEPVEGVESLLRRAVQERFALQREKVEEEKP